MKHRELGTSGVEVSEVGFGAWVVGTDWWGDRSTAQSVELVEHAIECGVTFFDTADVYGHGDSEELIGETLADRREEVTVSTKIGYDFYDNPQAGHGELPKKYTPEYVHSALDRSLDRLGFDHVDLLMVHNANVDEITPDILETLDELREAGKADAIGWALGPSIGWLAEGDAAVENEFDAVQLVFNVFEQVPGQHVIDTIRDLDADTSILPRVPHSSGLLNEQVTPDTELDAGDHRGFRPDEWYETGWEKVESVQFLERDGARTMGQAAIQWLLAQDEVASVTPTFRTTDDIDEWTGISGTPPISDDEFEQVQTLSGDNFGIDRYDGMDSLRSSVGGADLAGTDKQTAYD